MENMKLKKNNNNDYFKIVEIILLNPEFQKRKTYYHHDKITVYEHSLKVSIKSYKIAKILRLDYKSVAIAGLLHDFYDNPWQENRIKKTLFKKHGFVHAREALNNAEKNFPELLNPKVKNSILRHMFPLNIIPPSYLEGWIITIIDKYVSIEILKKPSKILNYVGLKSKMR